MKTDHLPTLITVHVQPRNPVFLSVSAGPDVPVLKTDRVIFAPLPGVLSVQGKGYRVPASLFADVRAALGLEGVGA